MRRAAVPDEVGRPSCELSDGTERARRVGERLDSRLKFLYGLCVRD